MEAGFAEASGQEAPAAAAQVAATEEVKSDGEAAPEGSGAARKEAAPAQAAAAAAGSGEADDVPPAVRKLVAGLTQQLQAATGRIGALQSAMEKGKQAASKSGGERPSSDAVTGAFTDPEAWKRFKEEFPEFAGPLEPEIKAIHAAIAAAKEAGKPVDVEALKTQFAGKADIDDAVDRAEERAVVRMKFPDWRKTVKTPEFTTWFKDQPEEFRKLGASPLADDAIKVFNDYDAHVKSKQKGQDDPRRRQQQRLESAAAPTTGGGARREHSATEEQAFLDGFAGK